MRGREPLVVWLLFGAVALEIFVTYSRLPASQLYHVSGSGVEGGASRAVVFLNFPTALVAIAIVAIAFERLPSRARAVAATAALLCTPVFWPGVVSQTDLDARWVNALAAIGVFLAFVVTATTVRGPADPRGDRLRGVVAILALLTAPAWLAADLGFFLPGHVYRTAPYYVHHGHHHGMDGVLLVLSSLLLSRQLPAIRVRVLRLATAAFLALMFAYGWGNIANDFWHEQVVKRGWASWAVPSVLEPRLTWAWLVLVLAAAALWAAWLSLQRSPAAGRTRRPSRAR